MWFSGLRGGVAFAIASKSFHHKDFPDQCGGFRGEVPPNWVATCSDGTVDDGTAILQMSMFIVIFTIFAFGGGMTSIAQRFSVIASHSRSKAASTADEALLDGGRRAELRVAFATMHVCVTYHPPSTTYRQLHATHRPPTTNHQPPAAIHHPPSTSHPPPTTYTTHDSRLTTHHSSLTTHHPPLVTHHSPLTTHHSPPITRHSLLTTHRLPLTTHLSLPNDNSLLVTSYLLQDFTRKYCGQPVEAGLPQRAAQPAHQPREGGRGR